MSQWKDTGNVTMERQTGNVTVHFTSYNSYITYQLDEHEQLDEHFHESCKTVWLINVQTIFLEFSPHIPGSSGMYWKGLGSLTSPSEGLRSWKEIVTGCLILVSL